MTFNVGHVQGGTNAGIRKPFNGKAVRWNCGCKEQPGYLKRCGDCKAERPDS